MMKELQTVRDEFSQVFQSHKAEASKHGGQSQPGPDPENTKMWQFISDEYNDLTVFVK